ncbi:MAG: methyl-accepting chemotaxis protein, partial [Ktedonobacterales bacterium]|nr:methyl-accepting chemotaxis protein [Ktedonobacterales bacterium]
YMTRSANDISVASRHQATTIERMTSAMAAVVEIADQVSGSSQQTTESAKRLDAVINELEQLVTGRARTTHRARSEAEMMNPGSMNPGSMNDGMMSGTPSTPPRMMGARPMGQPGPMNPANGAMSGARSASPPEAGYNVNGRPMLPGVDRSMPSRPRMNEPEGWSRTMDDRSSSGNYPYGTGGTPSRPNMDQGRNAR